MSIGYACIALGVPNTAMQGCLMKNASPDRLAQLIVENLSALERLIDYNTRMGIRLFRISSDLIPFGSSPVNTLDWAALHRAALARIGQKVRDGQMRVSMHPGQYTVLNSPDEGVVERAVADLEYHASVLEAMGLDAAHKLILHVGGVYGNKEEAAERFMSNWQTLSPTVKKRLVIENDERCYTAAEVLGIGKALDIPVVYDNLHNALNPSAEAGDDALWVGRCAATWKEADGPQKVHYSQQGDRKRPGAHSDTISVESFRTFYEAVGGARLDIMLEVKDKNLSALKCIYCMADHVPAVLLEQEWARYKYTVLEHSHRGYLEIRRLFRERNGLSPRAFYSEVDAALAEAGDTGSAVNGVMHVWGYFKKVADEKEKRAFLGAVKALENGETTLAAVKGRLCRLAEKYGRNYLLESYYFSL